MSCNLPRCKGTPERTTCGKNQREERALPRSQNPRLRAKKRIRVRSIARAIISASNCSEWLCFSFCFVLFSFVFFVSILPIARAASGRVSTIRRSVSRRDQDRSRRVSQPPVASQRRLDRHGDTTSAPRNVPHAITETIDVDTH